VSVESEKARADYDAGTMFGLERYCIERQDLRTFDAPNVAGYMCGAALRSEWSDGVTHGLALGAALHFSQAAQTTRLRQP